MVYGENSSQKLKLKGVVLENKELAAETVAEGAKPLILGSNPPCCCSGQAAAGEGEMGEKIAQL